ncbi:hypothetical protein [Variovorax sp. dw_954]|uniref:hypothetical protein n=1 Tax=Variovorax sp. dw_954 TaxID=2720078 RepID=UPI001BD5F7DE|nr:hypothetical protein [Variovorax sp. dw_954]
MGLLDRLFGSKASNAPRDEEVGRMVQRVIALHPRLRTVHGHEARLEAAVAKAAAHLRGLVAAFPPPRGMDAASWSSDPHVRAFFAAADDIPLVLGRSTELRAFLEEQPGLAHVFAVLGMAMNERNTLGVAREGDVMRKDVAQTTLSFNDHQIRICAPAEAEVRQAIVHRLIDQLAIEALARIASDDDRRGVLEQERALLATRVRLLARQGAGMASVTGGEDPGDASQLARLRARLEENDGELKALGPRVGALDRQLDVVCELFADASTTMHVTSRRVRLSRMNVILPEQDAEEGHALDLHTARVPGDPPRVRAFTLVRLARADVPKAANLLDRAEQML